MIAVESGFGIVYNMTVQNDCVAQMIIVFVRFILLNCCIMGTPRYEKEIELANCVLDYTRAKLKYKQSDNTFVSKEVRNQIIFKNFIKYSSVIKKYKRRVEKRTIAKWYAMRCCKVMLSLLDIGYDGSHVEVSADSIHNDLVEIFMKRKAKE